MATCNSCNFSAGKFYWGGKKQTVRRANGPQGGRSSIMGAATEKVLQRWKSAPWIAFWKHAHSQWRLYKMGATCTQIWAAPRTFWSPAEVSAHSFRVASQKAYYNNPIYLLPGHESYWSDLPSSERNTFGTLTKLWKGPLGRGCHLTF